MFFKEGFKLTLFSVIFNKKPWLFQILTYLIVSLFRLCFKIIILHRVRVGNYTRHLQFLQESVGIVKG